jgi:DNA excision repair protein ERCC-8
MIQWWPFDNGMFVTSSFDGHVNVWDPNSMEQVYSFDMKSKLYSMDISSAPPASPLVATASDHPLIRLLDLRTTSSTHTLSGHEGRVHAVKWSPTNSNLLASGGSDGTIRIWDIRRSRACVTSLDMQNVSPYVFIRPTLGLGANYRCQQIAHKAFL